MANPNPVKARLAQRRRRRAGDLRALTKAVWQAIRDAETALESAKTNDERCRAIHAMAAIANSYSKVLQLGEYEGRLAALEKGLEEIKNGHA